ncbi:MAG: beta-N-acetylhexosaminidase [Muribaculaceae bacterium]|nr:beta-N-acetylhexosaminidase [Muribaculaceae bacterium]
MKVKLLSAVMACAACFGIGRATTMVNITPTPKQMTVGTGELALPSAFTISYQSQPGFADEVEKFAAGINKSTGINVSTATSGNALVSVAYDSTLGDEAYTLDVTAEGVAITASKPAGLYYAFQTIKKIMPANVALDIYQAGSYSIPLVNIVDEPRYPWRGMEIDVARHYFDVDEIKKMLDIMAVYKMNRFHWHLTDDQGWRFEMPKYPKLTTDAAAPKNCYWWDFKNHTSFLTNQQYGPHFYTVEEMKDIVAYAKERHIEVCPEVDMPGHMQAAIAAYPEFSTVPDSDHPVRYWPGVSSDVLDISNPAVMQFLKDIIDQMVEIFPYEYIHIGGDECPTGNWAASPSCQAFKEEYNLSSDRAIQNWMVKELAEYARKDNRRLICWNEVISTAGADTELAKNADILIYSWLGAGTANNPSKMAADLGLRSVWCSTSHYYLDYPQWSGASEPHSMGYALNLELVYNARPDYEEAKKEFYYGVNCNLWTEFISEPEHLEYNALPRMIAVAETGWSPEANKNFDDFKARFNADTRMLDLGNYTYGRHYVDNPADKVMPEAGKYYRLITQASHDANRRDRCIELVHQGCSLISSKSATEGRLWTNDQAEKSSDHYNWQYWTFEIDPAGSGKYAMVNRMAPQGSVNPAMNGSSVNARWDYDQTTKHYNFLVGENFSNNEYGSIFTIRSDKGSDWYLNCAQSAQNQTVNNWNNPLDGNGGMWLFHLEDYVPAPEEGISFTPMTSGNYAFVNTLGHGPLSVTDGALTTEPDARFGNIGWTVTAGEYDAVAGTQTLTLKNMATGLYIAGLSAEAASNIQFGDGWGVFAGNLGHEVTFTSNAQQAATVTLSRVSEDNNYFYLTIDGKRIFAFGSESTANPNGAGTRQNAPEMQGSAWTVKSVAKAVKATATDGEETIGTFYHYDLEGEPAASNPIAIPYELYAYVSQTDGATADGHLQTTVTVTRIKRVVTYRLTDTNGMQWETITDTIGASEPFTPVAPVVPYLTFHHMGAVEGDVATVVYTTEATPGIGKLGAEVAAVEAGKIYAIEDAHAERHAFRGDAGGYVGGSVNAEGCSPAYLWTLEATGSNFYVKNAASGLYVQSITTTPTPALLAETPHAYSFTYSNGTWKITDTSNGVCWDGLENHNMVGWNSPGHPHRIYTVAEAEPFYTISISERLDGVEFSSRTIFVKAGASYIFAAGSRPGKAIVGIEGNEGLDEVYANKNIIVNYTADDDAITEIATDSRPSAKGIYDLNGRRLNKIVRPGVYIVNGVKTLVK